MIVTLQGFRVTGSSPLLVLKQVRLEQVLFDDEGSCADLCRRQQRDCRMPWATPQRWCSLGVQSKARWPLWCCSVMAL